ncbi:MAG TPA: DoxX family membrane protein [Candidatus Nanopelagicaceae bacterium]|nr:DoxX family membrane protein [Candidatus Nanopelagicaceae bacterium]
MRRSDLGLLTLRLATGAVLASHGLPKLAGGPDSSPPGWLSRLLGTNYGPAWEKSGTDAFATNLDRMGVPMPGLAARASTWAELGGGLALAAGAATPLASAAAVANMAVAVRGAHWKTGFYGAGGYEFPLLIGVAAAAIGLIGPGRLSVDQLFK